MLGTGSYRQNRNHQLSSGPGGTRAVNLLGAARAARRSWPSSRWEHLSPQAQGRHHSAGYASLIRCGGGAGPVPPEEQR
jgi:hypothetical protein